MLINSCILFCSTNQGRLFCILLGCLSYKNLILQEPESCLFVFPFSKISYIYFISSSGTLPLAAQESAVVEDLLYVLIGVDGRYITAQPLVGRDTRTFLVDPNLDMSVKELVTRILPVAASYSIISRY